MEIFIELLNALLPNTAQEWLLQIIISSIVSLIVISFMEYMIHRYLMHEGLPEWFYKLLPVLKNFMYQHRVLHHSVYYKQFDHEPDPVGRDLNIKIELWQSAIIGLLVLPVLVIIAWLLSAVPVLIFVAFALAHNLTWNLIHSEMHKPKHAFWTRWGIYKFLAQHHYMHHQDTHSNFNITVPLADFVLATHAKANSIHMKEITRLGYGFERKK